MKRKTAIVLIILGHTLMAQNADIGMFNRTKIIGNADTPVIANYDPQEQIYLFNRKDQEDTSGEEDGIRYIFREVKGDFIITATFTVKDNEGQDLELGFMARESDDENSFHLSAKVLGDGAAVMEWMDPGNRNGEPRTKEISAPKFNYEILQFERSGNIFTMRAAHFGEPLQEIASREKDMPVTLLLGIFCSADINGNETLAKISNLRLDKPVPKDYDPGQSGYLGSRLETLDIQNGKRRIVYVEKKRFEAPNWIPDGERLLFNMDGLLYTISLKGGELTELNTGFATSNNNDHGISFDGKMLAISHHREGLPGGGSTVYVLPIEGGEPQMVTEKTPSYWHGWAPNNREVVYVASREDNPNYNIYKKSIEGGEEITLTNTGELEHVDGPEYSPEGEYIYYNESASGTMQIWRMKPDGTQKEQITFDADNHWFSHISPDRKWIAYISFPPDIPVNDHPSYKRVTHN